ncbi:MAG: NUDIX domain-containing protein [Ktedonobacterales bacterium]
MDHVVSSSADVTDNPDELFDLVTPDDRVIGQIRRGEAHRNPALLHRSVQVLVFDDAGRVLLQTRSRSKDLFPGYACASAAGHVGSGDDYTHTAEREMREELGVTLPLEFVERVLVASPYETELTALFVARSNGPFVFHPQETAGGAFYSLEEISAARETGALALTPAVEAALEAVARLAQTGELAARLARL